MRNTRAATSPGRARRLTRDALRRTATGPPSWSSSQGSNRHTPRSSTTGCSRTASSRRTDDTLICRRSATSRRVGHGVVAADDGCDSVPTNVERKRTESGSQALSTDDVRSLSHVMPQLAFRCLSWLSSRAPTVATERDINDETKGPSVNQEAGKITSNRAADEAAFGTRRGTARGRNAASHGCGAACPDSREAPIAVGTR